MFDWRQLRRWNLSEAALPKGSIVINREVTFWDFKYYIIGGLAFLVLETALIIFLIVQRRRRNVAEESLRQKTEELDQFFNVGLDLKCIANTDGYFLRLNPAWERTLGYTPEELMVKRFLEFVHPDDLGRTREAVSTLSSQQKLISFENRYRCKDGTYRWLEWSSAPVGNLIFAAARDVTERKRAEAEASNARRELLRMDRLSRMGELTASLAHELNQPLAAILSNAQAGLRFIQSEKPDLNELRDILQDISSDDKRAGSVIRSLRAMIKQEEREREPLSINELVREVVSLFHSEAVLRNVIIETDFAESLPTLLADKIQLEQVVLNLIMNATEAMDHEAPEKRKISLKTERTNNGAIQVALRDYGPGIEKENLDRVFQPFFTTKGAGLGMGLSFSRSIIEAHGGRLWAENNPDKGATFFFEIPVISH
jgi:PAS domain S-box-containing protein